MADILLNGRDAVREGRGRQELHRVGNLSIPDLKEVALARVRQYWSSNHNGWIESHVKARPVDGQGNPVPWITYPCRHFLEQRVKPTMTLFEYGSGNSTIYWAKRLAQVVSCEHDESFYNEIKPQLPPNIRYLLHRSEAPYVGAAAAQGDTFDLIMIDGFKRWRSDCAIASIKALKASSVILWDNTDMKRFAIGIMQLKDCGFRQLEFRGHGPIWSREWSTSIFYRDGNCLGI